MAVTSSTFAHFSLAFLFSRRFHRSLIDRCFLKSLPMGLASLALPPRRPRPQRRAWAPATPSLPWATRLRLRERKLLTSERASFQKEKGGKAGGRTSLSRGARSRTGGLSQVGKNHR